MRTSTLPAAFVAAVLALASCFPEELPAPPRPLATEPGPHPAGASDTWMREVSARIRDASHTFVPDEQGFRGEVPERGLRGRFDADGAHLALNEDVIDVAVLAIGRDTLDPWEPAAPELGACLDDRFEPGGACVRRLEYSGADLTEWWASQEEGFEQGWTVRSPPEGDGPLTLALLVDGAEVSVGEGELWLQGDAGGLVMVSGLEARDADGVDLQAWFERTEEGFRIQVMDEGARYPVEIDPVYSTAAWSAYGKAADESFGYSVSGAGDVNGDGYDDVIVGAYGYISDTGRAYLYAGSSTGVSDTATTTLTGEAEGDLFGISVSGAGDLNGDGYSDVIVGAYGYSSNTGRAYVYAGSSSGLSDTAAVTMTGEARADFFGASVSDAGDLNGDGYDDVIVGAYGYSTYTGRAYVYAGSTSGVSDTAAITLTGKVSYSYFGRSVSGAGDVNGDGYDDVIVGAFGASDYDVEEDTYFGLPQAYVFEGSSTGPSSTAATTLLGETEGDYFGFAVSGAGDVNGDGYDDVIVGAKGYSSATGRAYVYAGSASGVSSSAATTLTGEGEDDLFGYSVSGVGDVNGDGYDDVIVGAYAYSSYTGRAYLYGGSSAGVSDAAATTLTGEGSFNHFGSSVSGAGDVNGDGYDDVIVGAPSKRRTYVYAGSAGSLSSISATTLTGEATSNQFGISVSGAGDVNGDGYGDVIVGANMYDSYTGRAYVYGGSASGVSDTAATTLTGESRSDSFGVSVSGAGDVNGDGYDDVIVGAYGYSTYTGRAYVYAGSAGGVSDTAATTLTGEATSTYFGVSVSGAGDVNGDGYDDLIVGADRYSASTGRAYVYAGSASGVSDTAAIALTGKGTYDYFGRSVSGAGDVNGDGYDDVIVGAYGYSSYTGRAYVYAGSSSGVSSTEATTLTGEGRSDDFGCSVSSAGDVNGDGYDDVIVGAEAYSSYTGRAYVYAGSSGGVSSAAETTLTGHGSSEDFGASVSGAGDVNGDGYDDLIVGAQSEGRTHVYAGSASGVSSTAATTLTGEGSTDTFGLSVAGAGDVNGDGYDDVIVGAYGYGLYGGAAYLYYGYDDDDDDNDGYTTSTDCDDRSVAAYPGAPETVADGIDQDCDGVDTCYTDLDGDGYGSTAVTLSSSLSCSSAGLSPNPADCDDTDAVINPEGIETVADGIDQDCDGVDACYTDLDGDGYGTGIGTDGSSLDCITGSGAVVSTDCDDSDSTVNPDAEEVCNHIDDDCDGGIDVAAIDAATWYADTDADGYTDPDTTTTACDAPEGYAAATEVVDCDDTLATVHPDADEVCNHIDDNCDGGIDVAAIDAAIWYADTDADGYTDPDATTTACDAPEGYAAASEDVDCDDTLAAVHPDADEVCNHIDDDCDSTIDTDAVDAATWYADADADGYTDPDATTTACDAPEGYAAASQDVDCDDTLATVHPDEDEVCNHIDDDCDGGIDTDAVDAATWYADADVDGYTDPDAVAIACDAPEGYTAATAEVDCDDADATSFPGADDVPDDGLDQDCDGVDTTSEDVVDRDDKIPPGCGCASANGASAAWALVFGVLFLTLRRREAA